MACVAVIPARRAERTIAATLESLRIGNAGFVEQVYVVTSDDDPTAAVVRRWSERDPRVVLVGASHDRSAGAARNAGRVAASASDSGLILFLDADCRLERGGAARLAFELRARGEAARCARVLGEGGVIARVRHILEFKEASSRRRPPARWLPPSTALLCERGAFDRAGGFVDLWPGEDLVFAQTLRDLGARVGRSDEVVAVHRHPPGVFEMLRHQWRLGRTAAIARRLRPMPGSRFASSAWTGALLLPARALRIAAWQAREGAAAIAWSLLLAPLLGGGLFAWTAGFVSACALSRPSPAPRLPLAGKVTVA